MDGLNLQLSVFINIQLIFEIIKNNLIALKQSLSGDMSEQFACVLTSTGTNCFAQAKCQI